jgi:hypothetical protein
MSSTAPGDGKKLVRIWTLIVTAVAASHFSSISVRKFFSRKEKIVSSAKKKRELWREL